MNKNLRRVSITVTAQTLNHLKTMSAISGCSMGKVIDKLVRDKMLTIQEYKTERR